MTISNKILHDPVACCAEVILSRDLLSSGAFEALIAADAPMLRLLSEKERWDSLASILAARPAG